MPKNKRNSKIINNDENKNIYEFLLLKKTYNYRTYNYRTYNK